jgi:hypothetical protein
METYRILSCLCSPHNSLRSVYHSLRSPQLVGFGCLPSLRSIVTLLLPRMETTWGKIYPCAFSIWQLSPHLPFGK